MLLATKLMGANKILTFVSSATGVASIASMPAHQAGDFMVAFAAYSSVATTPTPPAGWSTLTTKNGTSSGVGTVVAYKVAASGAETSGTWTNSHGLILCVYRNAESMTNARTTSSSASVTSVVYSGITTLAGPGTSFALGVVATKTGNTAGVNTPPTGAVNRQYIANANVSMAFADTNQGVSSVGSSSVPVYATISGYNTTRIELKQI